MNTTLTSWKEIAAYMGKGVRTVQRWEMQFGLPVRRPSPNSHVIFAIPEELDAWIRQHQPASMSRSNHGSPPADRQEKRLQHETLIKELKNSYARLESNGQLLSTNLNRLLAGFNEAVLRASRLRRLRGNIAAAAAAPSRAQTKGNAA